MDLAKLDYWVSCAERIQETCRCGHDVPFVMRPHGGAVKIRSLTYVSGTAQPTKINGFHWVTVLSRVSKQS